MANWKARQSAGRRNAANAVKQQLRKAGGVDQVVLLVGRKTDGGRLWGGFCFDRV
mgnify:CR=1 FL=1